MNKLNFKIIIIYILIGGFIFSLLFFSMKDNWNLSFILKDIMYFPIKIMNIDNDYTLVIEGRQKELEQELNDLKDMLAITETLTEFRAINATVINRNTSYWNEELIINKGRNSGIKEGMAVVDGKGLIGKVTKTSLSTAIVKLITSNSNDNKISVKLWSEDKSINKILEQDSNHNLLISGIDNSFPINIGDLITTSGLSDIYPSGITIGYVNKIDYDKFGISKKAYIKYSSDLENVRFVSVLMRGS